VKRLVVLSLFVILVVVLSGCAAPQTVEKVVEKVVVVTSAPAPAVDAGKTYYWLAANNSNPFYVPGLAGWEQAAKDLGVKVSFVGPEEPNLADQIKTFEQLVANPNTAGILFYAMDFNAAEPLVKDAEAKGIPVVIANTDSPFKTRSAFIGTDHIGMGYSAAAVAAKAINCKGSVGAIGNNSVVVPQRMEAFNKQIKVLCPDVEVREMGLYDGSALAAVATVDAYMVKYPDLTLLWFADGAAGQTVQPWKDKIAAGTKTLFLGCDMPPAALDAVKDGTWIASMGQDTYAEEYWGLTFLASKVRGKAIPDSTYPRALVVTKDNVDQFIGK
jgi:ribose transport system substrate-binding protein